ncbi:MAG TPA: hypothetical protein VFL13_08350 [Candidatus Baltobacteraceae bacterium]|nr:hypothetical protein [Candidatus Baltobacteraceae bacterium]
MKHLVRTLCALVLTLAIPLPAIAQTHVIAELGTAPLIGQISSTGELQTDFSREQALFRSAGSKLGLTPKEYAAFGQRLSAHRLAYVVIPRHLDAMSWSSGGQVYILHDVQIPANTHGWEIDLDEPGSQVALFIPARCGNLSIVRRSAAHLARTAVRVKAKSVAVSAANVQSAAAAPAPAAPAQPAVYVTQQPAPAPSAAPYQSVAAATPAVHRPRLWPLLLIPLIGFLSSSHSGAPVMVAAPAVAGAPAPGSTPPPASCKTTPK